MKQIRRKAGESIFIGDSIEVCVVTAQGGIALLDVRHHPIPFEGPVNVNLRIDGKIVPLVRAVPLEEIPFDPSVPAIEEQLAAIAADVPAADWDGVVLPERAHRPVAPPANGPLLESQATWYGAPRENPPPARPPIAGPEAVGG